MVPLNTFNDPHTPNLLHPHTLNMTIFRKSEYRAVWDAMKPDIFTTRLFFDPLAVPLTVLFSKVGWISANVVTFSALIPGLLGAWCFAMGWFGWGASAYYLFFLLDSVDGKLARLLGAGDPLGAFYDFVVDRIVIGAMLLGMAWTFIQQDLMAELVVTQLFLLTFFLKDVFDLKWKESGVRVKRSLPDEKDDVGFFARYKLHFKPGQLLSCFIIFMVGPLSGMYIVCALVAMACVVFSMTHNVLVPWFYWLKTKG